MATLKKWHILGIATAIVLCMTLIPLSAGAQDSQTIVVKEKAIVSDTVVDPNMSAPADGELTRERPFQGNREMAPAGSAIVGEKVISGELGPDIVNYASSVSSRTPNELVLNTVISKAEDDATLSRLAAKVYMDNGGANYDNVTIFWHVGDKPQPADPWGRTDIRKGDTVFKVIRYKN